MVGIPYDFETDGSNTCNIEHFQSNDKKCNLQQEEIVLDNVTNEFIVGKDTRLTRICPHNGCLININEKKDGFICPCHKSTFDKCGNCLGGPACPNSIKK